MEFLVPTMRIAVHNRLSKNESLQQRMEELLKLDEDRLKAYWVTTTIQRRRKRWVDRHSKLWFLNVCTPVLLFNTKSGLLPGKLQLRWIGPFWIVQKIGDGTFILGQIDGTINPKAVNGYRLKPYFGQMPPYPFFNTEPTADVSVHRQPADFDADISAVSFSIPDVSIFLISFNFSHHSLSTINSCALDRYLILILHVPFFVLCAQIVSTF